MLGASGLTVMSICWGLGSSCSVTVIADSTVTINMLHSGGICHGCSSQGCRYPNPLQLEGIHFAAGGNMTVPRVQKAGNCCPVTAENVTFFLLFDLKTLIFSHVQNETSDRLGNTFSGPSSSCSGGSLLWNAGSFPQGFSRSGVMASPVHQVLLYAAHRCVYSCKGLQHSQAVRLI